MPYLEELSVYDLVQYLNQQDLKPQLAVAGAVNQISQAIEAMVPRMEQGGKVRVAGAGTSGRLAQLDASELPPTFGIDQDQWKTLMAGGRDAFWNAVEGAEDNVEEGFKDMASETLGMNDIVIGVAASGRTPYVQGALQAAERAGCLRIGIFCVSTPPLQPLTHITIAIPVGPEPLSGSTRMLAGTAQKMVLNIISTGVMVRLGHTLHNLMIDMKPSNHKLKLRAEAIVQELLDCDDNTARNLLQQHQYQIRPALIQALTGSRDWQSFKGSLGPLWQLKHLDGIDIPAE